MARVYQILILLLLSRDCVSSADTLSFEDVWQKVREASAVQKGSELKIQSVEEGLSRSKNHWLPKVYLSAQSYRTNDPGNIFFGLLEQRRVSSTDFSPELMNHPAAQNFTKGALGVDLALYEGGAKSAQVDMYRHISAAEKLNASQLQIEQYAQAGLAYGSIVSARVQRTKLMELSEQLTQLIKKYQLGQKANPVGYSGLLGMKSLANRIGGIIEQLDAREKSDYATLREMGVPPGNWIPGRTDVSSFINHFLPSPNEPEARSYRIRSGKETVLASVDASRMDRSRYLPKVGAFAESNVFNGSRATAGGYTAGLYLQWSLFDPSDYGKYKEAKLAAMATEAFHEASVQQESAERAGLLEMERALKSNLGRLDQSDKLMAEQTLVSSTLFKNGSINALQFVEILNRRIDLITQHSDTEIALLKTSAERAKKSGFEIPQSMNRRLRK